MRCLFLLLVMLLVPDFLSGQAQSGGLVQLGSSGQVSERFKHIPAKPVSRRADGTIVLGSNPGEIGLWLPYHGATDRLVIPDNDSSPQFAGRPRLSEVPFQPWARALHEYRRDNQLEPHTRCKPSGGPRQFLTPYGVEIVDIPESRRIYIIDQGGPHTYRVIYMDGRPHPENPAPSHYGHSIGRWEGDTLIVDTVGFNEAFWFDRSGLPHTSKLHMIERFTRTDSKTMKYDVTIDDPGAYTAIWSSGFLFGWDPEQELFEYICQDNNYASSLMVGNEESLDRQSLVVP